MLLQGAAAKAKSAYQDFLTLWKDADQTFLSYRCHGREACSGGGLGGVATLLRIGI
jgi:hypothetical protein